MFYNKIYITERASQEEQNGTNFSFIAPSSEELHVHVRVQKEFYHGLYTVQGFQPKTDCGRK